MAVFHEVKWDEEKVGFFWDSIKNVKKFQDLYFTKEVGDGLLKLTNKNSLLQGDILDFGCGHGYLTEKLLNYNVNSVTICDFSPESLELVKNKIGKSEKLKDSILISELPEPKLADNSFDFVFFIETIEHVLDHQMKGTLNELYRVLKPGGKLVITTPNDEDLDESKIICPECGAFFHKFQHVRKFTADSLSTLMTKHGFETKFCKGVTLFCHQEPLFSLSYWKNHVKAKFKGQPNLFYIGEKAK